MSCSENSGDGISSGEIGRGENILRWNLTRQTFHAVKFNALKISRGEIFCGGISGNEKPHIIFLGKILQKHWKLPEKLPNTEKMKFFQFKYLKNFENSIIIVER